jgi:N-acetylglucosaminyldiphosphoundecaprenol N-acetyl-beta-D-mannosaminyltransferase
MLILKWAKARESRSVCLANVHMLMEAYWDENFARVLDKADLVSSDGMPLVWMLRGLGVYNQNRVAGMDVFLSLCDLSQQSHISIFFVGSQPSILERIKEKIEKEFPLLKIAGMESLPFRPLTKQEDKALITKINQSKAGLVFVCLGCPKQEFWIAKHQGQIEAVMIGVGAVFATYAGIVKRAPYYIREWGFEWLYRLFQEPYRLWKRYSETIPPFIYLAFKQILEQYLFKVNYDEEKNQIHPEIRLDYLSNNYQTAKIGTILVRQNLITEEALNLALQEQQKNPQNQLGEILIAKGYISLPELEYYLKNQNIKLGEMLIEKKIILSNKLINILKIQKQSKNKLGEILIEQKIISQKQLQSFLLEQYLRRQGLWLTNK